MALTATTKSYTVDLLNRPERNIRFLDTFLKNTFFFSPLRFVLKHNFIKEIFQQKHRYFSLDSVLA